MGEEKYYLVCDWVLGFGGGAVSCSPGWPLPGYVAKDDLCHSFQAYPIYGVLGIEPRTL